MQIGGIYRGMVPVPGYANMYAPYSSNGSSPVPGIGVIFKVNGSPITLNNPPAWTIGPGGGSSGYYYYSATWSIEFYKIGELDSKTSWTIPLSMSMGINGNGPYALGGMSVIGIASTCKVATSNVVIPLGDVNASVFTSVGSTSTRSREYNINLNCTANPSVRMSVGGTAVAGRSDLFGLTDSGTTAGGIAVQLFRSGSQLNFWQNILLTSAAGATLSVPISANYYRTGAVTPGSANAHMVATFTYN